MCWHLTASKGAGIRERIEAAFEERALLEAEEYRAAVFDTVAALDRGELRVARKREGVWTSNAWVMKAINLYFAVAEMRTWRPGPRVPRTRSPNQEEPAGAVYESCPRVPYVTGLSSSPASSLCPEDTSTRAYVGNRDDGDTWGDRSAQGPRSDAA